MIEKIKFGSVNNNKYTPQKNDDKSKNPSFKGGWADLPIMLVQQCEKQPMVNVSFLDLSTAIVPRTIVETKESNAHAGFEAFRRESSGLVVNCLIPSFIVMGLAKLFQAPVMGKFGKSNLFNTWANSDAIDKIQHFYSNAKGLNKEDKIRNTFKGILGSISGVDADKTVDFSKVFGIARDKDGKLIVDKNGNLKVNNSKADEAINKLTKAVLDEKPDKHLVKDAYNALVGETHIAENIKFRGDKGFFSNNLESVCDDTVKMLRDVVKQDIKGADLSAYFKKAKNLVNVKSLAGLAVILPLACLMQPINRWITHKTSGKKGAPIYKDFNQQTERKEMTSKEKGELLAQKFISIGSMVGVSVLSMLLDKPSLKMFQFKGLFPTMDQARIISTATFASRMGAAEDRNELREATVRDIATFSSFYFLGDYVAKGIATLIEHNSKKDGKPTVHLINRLKTDAKTSNPFKQLWNWAKHTSLKSSDELATIKDKKLRTLCQIGNIVFSLLSLGVFIPIYTRATTNKRHAAELAKKNAQNGGSTTGATTVGRNSSSDEFSKSLIKDSTAFKAFFNS